MNPTITVDLWSFAEDGEVFSSSSRRYGQILHTVQSHMGTIRTTSKEDDLVNKQHPLFLPSSFF